MKIRRRLHKASLVVLIALSMFAFGCGGFYLRASDSMFKGNSIKKIAILSTGRVVWPRVYGKEPVLGLTENKQALTILTPKLREILVNKGYEVVFSEPVGIGYFSPYYKENWVIETEKGEEYKWQVVDYRPAFEYPVVQNNQEFCKAVRNIFEQIEAAIKYYHKLWTFTPFKDDLEVIRQVTGADTICLMRVSGDKFSTIRKTMRKVFGQYAPRGNEWVHAFLFFVNTSSGEVLWQNHAFPRWEQDPANPGEMVVNEPLKYFPKINQPMEGKCKKKDPDGPKYKCPKIK